VHNRIVQNHPELAPVLAGPWFFDRKNEVSEAPGALPAAWVASQQGRGRLSQQQPSQGS
jgi:hypothetical protein